MRRMPETSSTIVAVIDARSSRLDDLVRHQVGRRITGAHHRHRATHAPPPPRRSPPRSPPGRPASAGPRSPNSALACESQASSNDATSTSSPLPPLTRPLARARSPLPRLSPLPRFVAGRRRRRSRNPPAVAVRLVARERQRELARVVDVVDPHRDLVAEVEHVFDPVDALAATELGDVQQTVAAGEDVDERTELGDVHHLAGVLGAELRGGRVEDQLDPSPRLLDRGAVLRADAHGADDAVVADRHVGAGLLGDRVDDLALGPDHLADLVHRDLEADDLRRGGLDVVAVRGDLGVHDVEDLQAGVAGLEQRLAQHVGREAVDLGVELQRGDEVARCRRP